VAQFERPTFEEFRATVYKEPWSGGVFIVDGDTPVPTVRALRAFYDRHHGARGSLIVHQEQQQDAIWDGVQRKSLTYCVSNNFGANKAEALEAIKEATEGGWELFGDINFVHLAEEDANCNADNQNVLFDVRQTSGAPYLARAFFPGQGRQTRNVLVDSSAFGDDFDELPGLFAHELGHSLGFRHEHTRPESGATQCFEDNEWRALTSYDSDSVMHYPQCNGTGEPLTFSSRDGDGIAVLYGPAGDPVCGDTYCSGNETCESCEADCGACPECGNDVCENGESCDDCPGDCGACPECGDGACNGDETCGSCESDCGECVCDHPLCEAGAALDKICDPCVTSICDADPFCCNIEWDFICVEQVTTVCDQTCN
jgi:hypothetical protein